MERGLPHRHSRGPDADDEPGAITSGKIGSMRQVGGGRCSATRPSSTLPAKALAPPAPPRGALPAHSPEAAPTGGRCARSTLLGMARDSRLAPGLIRNHRVRGAGSLFVTVSTWVSALVGLMTRRACCTRAERVDLPPSGTAKDNGFPRRASYDDCAASDPINKGLLSVWG